MIPKGKDPVLFGPCFGNNWENKSSFPSRVQVHTMVY